MGLQWPLKNLMSKEKMELALFYLQNKNGMEISAHLFPAGWSEQFNKYHVVIRLSRVHVPVARSFTVYGCSLFTMRDFKLVLPDMLLSGTSNYELVTIVCRFISAFYWERTAPVDVRHIDGLYSGGVTAYVKEFLIGGVEVIPVDTEGFPTKRRCNVRKLLRKVRDFVKEGQVMCLKNVSKANIALRSSGVIFNFRMKVNFVQNVDKLPLNEKGRSSLIILKFNVNELPKHSSVTLASWDLSDEGFLSRLMPYVKSRVCSRNVKDKGVLVFGEFVVDKDLSFADSEITVWIPALFGVVDSRSTSLHIHHMQTVRLSPVWNMISGSTDEMASFLSGGVHVLRRGVKCKLKERYTRSRHASISMV